MMNYRSILIAMAAIGACATASAQMPDLLVGLGRQVITPERDMWMAGYASRRSPSEGKIHDLWAKALAVQDATGARSVIVTTDLLGLPATISRATAALAEERLGIPRDRLMLTSSHTHSGPVLRDNLVGMYELDETQAQLMREYTEALPELLMAAIEAAIADLEPGTLRWGIGTAGFAKNRRKYTPGGVTNNFNPIGPVDHDVPVLAALRRNGTYKGLLFGYACHNTVLGLQEFCGDYAGFAQYHLEGALPGVTAMFVAGCGGDQNPLPRRTLSLAKHYGESLGDAVLDVLHETMSEVAGPLDARYEEIDLGLSAAPSRATIEAQRDDGNVYIRRRAENLLETLDRDGALPETYPYPVQVWQFADDLQLTALGGEVVVDYSLRLKNELGRDRQFVIAYANDVMAYIPSLRVLREGGYEGRDAMVYYGFHGPWDERVEEDIVATVHRLSGTRQLVNLHDEKSLGPRRPLMIAHRGGVITPTMPECSAAAIHAAADAGYDMVELDIQVSKDGRPIVFHDRALAGACGLPGAIEDYTAREVRAFRFIANGEAVLDLEDALRICAARRLGVMLDFKTFGDAAFFERVIGIIERYRLTQSVLCINGAAEVREHLAGHVMLTGGKDGGAGTFWFGIASKLVTDEVAALHQRGALVISAVNTFRYDSATHMTDARADIERLTAAGVDGIQIDSIYQDFTQLATDTTKGTP